MSNENPFKPDNVTKPDENLVVQTAGVISSKTSTVSSKNLGNVQPDDNVSSSTGTIVTNTSGTTAETLPNFLPNVLNGLDNATYNFKLYLAPEGQLLDSTTTPKGPFYVIAQSGVTSSFYVKDVEIESTVGPNPRTRNIRSTVIRMTIAEPQGISLVDKLISAAAQLNIKNINVCPMMIELSFKGYDSSGRNQSLKSITKTWRVNLIDINTNLTEGGSEYEMSFMVLEDYAFNKFSAAAVIQQQLTFPVTTVGKFFEDLSYYLTLQSATTSLHSQQGQIARNEYVFNVNPIMSKWQIGEMKRNSPSMFIEDGGKRSIVLNTDLTIDRIVDLVLSTTVEGNTMVNPSSSPEKMDQQPKTPKISKIANVSGRVEFINFNTVANDYNRRYVYYINPYETVRTIIDKPSDSDQQERSKHLLQSGLRKKYEYIFTGQNTEVLRLDLNLNNLWRSANVYYANALQRKNNPNAKFLDPQNKTSKVTSPDDLRTQARNSTFAYSPVPGSNDSLTVTTNNSTLFTTQNVQSDNTVTDPRTKTLAALDQLTSSGQINADKLKTLTTSIDQDISNAIPVESPLANVSNSIPVLSGTQPRLSPKINKSQQLTLSNNLLETLNSDLLSKNQNPILSMFVKQIDPEIDTLRVNNNIEETTNVGRSIYGIVVNQLYQTQYQDLLNINLEIKGDPFWLGESDVELYNRLSSYNLTEDLNVENPTANFLRGENCIFLTFNTPVNYDQSTGYANVTKADLFVGVYAVIKIYHTFSDGKFTQRLECIRDITTDPKVLAKMVNINGITNGLANSPGLNSITTAITKLL